MPNSQIEIILARQFADCLSIPVFIVDTNGNLLFYNEPAEALLGLRFGETGSMAVEEWSTVFKPTDENGQPLAPEKLPLVQTLGTQKPAHGSFWIDSLSSNEKHLLTVTSFPLMGRPNRFLGAVALFWKSN